MEGQQVQRNPAPNLPPELDAEAEDHADDEHQQQDRGSDKDYRGDRGGSSLSVKHIELWKQEKINVKISAFMAKDWIFVN